MNSGKFVSATIPGSRLLPGIHGLRGLAALAVVLFHLNHLSGISVPAAFAFIGRDFGYGAHLFFVLSAFSLMHSTERSMHRPGWVGEYLVKRFFRIAPLFYCVIALELARQLIFSGKLTTSVSDLVLNLSFAFGFVPWSGFVWGGWTIGVEMIFYVTFPVLMLLVRTSRQALLLLVLMTVVSYAARYKLNAEFLQAVPRPKWDWSYFSFVSNLYFFAAGLYAYRLWHELDKGGRILKTLIPLVAVLLLGVLMLTEFDRSLRGGGRADLLVWAVGFTALCVWQAGRPTGWVASKFLEYVGERSFSIYLLHPVCIYILKTPILEAYAYLGSFIGEYAFFVCGLGVLLAVAAVAELTYRFIEVPGIKLGRRYISKHGQGA